MSAQATVSRSRNVLVACSRQVRPTKNSPTPRSPTARQLPALGQSIPMRSNGVPEACGDHAPASYLITVPPSPTAQQCPAAGQLRPCRFRLVPESSVAHVSPLWTMTCPPAATAWQCPNPPHDTATSCASTPDVSTVGGLTVDLMTNPMTSATTARRRRRTWIQRTGPLLLIAQRGEADALTADSQPTFL